MPTTKESHLDSGMSLDYLVKYKLVFKMCTNWRHSNANASAHAVKRVWLWYRLAGNKPNKISWKLYRFFFSWFEVFTKTPTAELTETNCHARLSCSKHCCCVTYRPIIFIWFTDRMVFTLATHSQNDRLDEFATTRKKEVGAKRLFFAQERRSVSRCVSAGESKLFVVRRSRNERW